MNKAEKWSLSVAVCVLICFFLSWAQVSYFVTLSSASDFNIPHSNTREFWLIPAIMLIVILFGLFQLWKRQPLLYAFVGVVGGLTSAYLMNRERIQMGHSASLAAASLEGWISSGFVLSLLLTFFALVFYFKPTESS